MKEREEHVLLSSAGRKEVKEKEEDGKERRKTQ
jgi:hypothetical protein